MNERIQIEEELLESLYWGNLYSRDKIAEIFNCSTVTVQKRMDEYGISTRNVSEAAKVKDWSEEAERNRLKGFKKKLLKDGHPMKGKHHSEESKKKMSESRKGMPSPKKIIIEEELLWALYWGNDYTMKEIADILNLGYDTIKRRMNEYNIPKKKLGQHQIIKIKPETLWKLHYEKLYNLKEMSKILNIHASTIHKKMKEYDIPIRTKKIDIEPELLWSLHYGNCYTLKKIAKLLNVGTDTIERRRIEYNIPLKQQSLEERKKYQNEWRENNKDKKRESDRKWRKKSNKYQKNVAKRRGLKWTLLIKNPFPEEIEVDYHHINDMLVVPIPKTIHRHCTHNNINEHRERCNVWMYYIYGIDFDRLLDRVR